MDHVENREQDTPVNYKYISSEFSRLYECLEAAGLTVPISVPSAGSIPHLDVLQSVTAALVEAGFEIPGYPDFKTAENVRFSESLPFRDTWYRIMRAKKNGNSIYSSVVPDDVVPINFDYSQINNSLPPNPSDFGPDRSPPPPLLLLGE